MEIINVDEEGVNPPEKLYICLVFLFLPFVDSLEFSTINTNNDVNPKSLYWIKPFLVTSFYIWNVSYTSIQSAFNRSSTIKSYHLHYHLHRCFYDHYCSYNVIFNKNDPMFFVSFYPNIESSGKNWLRKLLRFKRSWLHAKPFQKV